MKCYLMNINYECTNRIITKPKDGQDKQTKRIYNIYLLNWSNAKIYNKSDNITNITNKYMLKHFYDKQLSKWL